MKKTGLLILSLFYVLDPSVSPWHNKHPRSARFIPLPDGLLLQGSKEARPCRMSWTWPMRAGGINGKKIQYYWADGEYKDDVGIAAFKRLYTQYNPQIMFGQSTGMTKALGPEIKDPL